MTDNLNSPHDREAEQGVLGAILHENDNLDRLRGMLDPEHFNSPAHQRIFRAMQVLHQQGKPVDEVTLSQELNAQQSVDSVGGVVYLAELADMTPVASNVLAYAEIVLNAWRKRRVMQAAYDAYEGIKAKGSLAEVTSTLRKALDEAEHVGVAPHSTSAQDGVVRFVDWLESGEHASSRVRTWTRLDRQIHRIDMARPTVIAARTGVGKTVFGTQTVVRNAENGVPGLLFNLEMDETKLIGRILSQHANISGKILLHRDRALEQMGEWSWDRLGEAAKNVSGWPFWIHTPQRPMSVPEIERVARWHRDNHEIEFVVVDHLRRIRTVKGTTYEQQSQRITDLADMQQVLELPVVVMAQINREPGESVPKLHHLEGSGQIEQCASAVIILHDETPEDPGEHELIAYIAKNDAGEKGDVRMPYSPSIFKIDTQPSELQGEGK